MATRFLRSKTTAPTLHQQAVSRSRLAKTLRESTGPLVLLSAPAGYGKTTLLVQALADHPGTVAWVTVDSADNDPLRFWTHVAAAVLGEGPCLDTIATDLGAGESERDAAIDQLLVEIEAISSPVLIVLDDLHEVFAEEILDALGRILANPPANLQVIASTRSDPALPTGRLRAQGRLTEIRASDLAFTVHEAAEIFGDAADQEALQTIVKRTEGWPTAVRLLEVASTSARTGPDLLNDAALGSPDLADFLSAEALGVLRPELQHFLVETASLNDLTPTVCDTVTGRAGSLSLLRELATNQVFTVLIEPASNTYRYHQLFREFLRGKAQELPLAERQARAQRAADFYAEHAQASEAIRMSLEAGNDKMAVSLILEFNLPYAQSGWIVTVFEWLNAFGRDRVAEQPELSLLLAWAFLNMKRYGEIEETLGVPALADPTRDSTYGAVGAQIQAIRSHWNRHVGDAVTSLADAELGLTYDDDPGSISNCVVGSARGIAKALLGLDATPDFERSVSVGLTHSIDSSAMVGYSGLALQASRDPERVDEAAALADQALAFCTTPALTNFHQPVIPLVVKARASRADGRVGDAAGFARDALTVANEGHEPLFAVLALVELARISHLENNVEACRVHLREAEALLSEGAGQHLAELVRTARNETRFVSLEGRDDLPLGANELTDREMGVVRLLPHGLSRKELAEQLFISENTLKTHLTSIRHKLGVSGRADIAARATELGIIS